jgi:poly(beta-D-mannuronate) lyase
MSEEQHCTPDELPSHLSDTAPGETFVLDAGNYSDVAITIDGCGEPDRPITIKCEAGSVILTGRSSIRVAGAHLVLKGLTFDGCVLNESCITFEGAEDCRVVDCLFTHSEGSKAAIRIMDGAHRNVVENCEFAHLEQRSVQVVTGAGDSPTDNRIVGNCFRDIPPIPSGNGRETIQIGQNQPQWGHLEPRTIIERNRFLRCDGEIEIISNKSSKNYYRHNLFMDCQGEVVMRGGSYCEVHGNRHVNCKGGIRLSGTHHTVTHNVIENCANGFRTLYGMTIELGGLYQATADCLVAHNTVIGTGKTGLTVGLNRMMDRDEKGIAKHPPTGNRFVNNVFDSDSGTHLVVVEAPDNEVTDNLFAGSADKGDVPEGNLVEGDGKGELGADLGELGETPCS